MKKVTVSGPWAADNAELGKLEEDVNVFYRDYTVYDVEYHTTIKDYDDMKYYHTAYITYEDYDNCKKCETELPYKYYPSGGLCEKCKGEKK